MNDTVEIEIQKLKKRNARVETDKAWETSLTRRTFIAFVTYLVAAVWLHLIHESNIFLKAVVPVAGYVLSTFSIPQLKKIWIQNVYRIAETKIGIEPDLLDKPLVEE